MSPAFPVSKSCCHSIHLVFRTWDLASSVPCTGNNGCGLRVWDQSRKGKSQKHSKYSAIGVRFTCCGLQRTPLKEELIVFEAGAGWNRSPLKRALCCSPYESKKENRMKRSSYMVA